MEVYEIYTDASFLSKVPLKYSGAYIVYLNSKKIYENSYVRHIKNEGKAEIYNLNKSMVDIANRYISRDKKQIFIFVLAFYFRCLLCLSIHVYDSKK